MDILITASVGDFTSPTLNRDFVLSTLDYSTNIFTWSAESGASAGTDDNYKYSNSILYNYYMICVTYDYVSESPLEHITLIYDFIILI